MAGVSDGMVSNTLNRPHLVNAETRERVRQAVEAVGYVPTRRPAPCGSAAAAPSGWSSWTSATRSSPRWRPVPSR
ncbi:LacI family DNA-binding transcriptional regulator [Actinoplanes sp. CA-015351]|uniref:LacI family DNA-binding transcriptional regulator n=1 Tax=Actinoplanes sp. CA-015351 TaxID=3239897 RepID=UPI003D985B7F